MIIVFVSRWILTGYPTINPFDSRRDGSDSRSKSIVSLRTCTIITAFAVFIRPTDRPIRPIHPSTYPPIHRLTRHWPTDRPTTRIVLSISEACRHYTTRVVVAVVGALVRIRNVTLSNYYQSTDGYTSAVRHGTSCALGGPTGVDTLLNSATASSPPPSPQPLRSPAHDVVTVGLPLSSQECADGII